MGWTSYSASHYDKRGNVDRKAECDSMFDKEFKVLKSRMIGSTYYAAVQDTKTNEVWGAVFLTQTAKNVWYNFAYKDMDETVGPCECQCPMSIIKLLSPTDNEWANQWRQRCIEHNKHEKEIKNAPLGTKVSIFLSRFGNGNKDKTAVKTTVGGKTYWMTDYCHYIKPSLIISAGYEIV